MNWRNIFRLFLVSAWVFALLSGNAVAQQSPDEEGVKAASKAFYAALAVIDDGTAMDKVVAHTPYITFTSPRGNSIYVGYDAWKKYWPNANKLFLVRTVSLSEQHIHVNGNLAWEMGEETGDAKLKNGTARKVNYLVTNVYERIDGHWLMVSHHAQPKPQ